MHRRWTFAVVLAMAVAGCGGSATTTTTSSLTAAQLRTRADAICTRLNARILKAEQESPPSDGGDAKTPAQRRIFAEVIATMTSLLRQAATSLAALDPPATLRGTYRRMTHALRDVAAGFPTREEAMAHRDPRAKERDDGRQRFATLADDLGLQVCG